MEQGRQRPGVGILRVEETDLDHDSALPGLADKILEAFEVLRIPPIQVKLIAADQIPWLIASRPRHSEAGRLGSERVAFNELSHRLEQRSRIDARVIEP